MNFKRCIGHFLITLLMLTQLSLAQHATVHFLESGHAPVHQQEKGDLPFKEKPCQICQLSHDYSKLLAYAGPEFLLPVLTQADNFGPAYTVHLQSNPSPYTARAPPAFSA